ncbi:hypothetical protein [Phenylobacterium sp.]|uniref:hypothetical protein n=1 Tax=Phenylobacterium sp. TaxID=1871053 RepID=UPI0025D0AF0E|nr:hypothetical protein [Phenylobacterium sp.]
MNFKAIAGWAAALLLLGAGHANAVVKPDPAPPMNAPDAFAWKLFLVANAPAGGTRSTFETWASDTDTFRPNPVFPTTATPLSLHPPALQQSILSGLQAAGQPLPQVPPGAGALEETRRNKATFDFIVKNKLFSISGLKAGFGKDFSFPLDAVEVKANWIALTDVPVFSGNRVSVADAPKFFHVNTGTDGKKYALVSMHVISKATPNWTWATFESEFNPGRCAILGCRDSFGATTAYVPPNANGSKAYGPCAKTPALAALIVKAKLEAAYTHYCLKGSQVDFTDNTGLNVRLGNSVTEDGFVDSSSCMTCHSRSAWAPNGTATSQAGFLSFSPLRAPVGPIDPHWYWTSLPTPPNRPTPPAAGATRTGTSADFVWSIAFCAYDDTDPAHPKPSPCTGK